MNQSNSPTPKDAEQTYVCVACGYMYDAKQADATGVYFWQLADDWCCPLCGITKDNFELYDTLQETAYTTNTKGGGTVIVGAGLAGWATVEALRTLDADAPITLICSDSGDRYHKPMLSTAISSNKTPSDLVRDIAVRSASDLHIRLLANTEVTHIDTHQQILHTTSGNVGYDNLVLAIGATVAYPPGMDKEHTHHVNNLESFAKFQQTLTSPKTIAIMGAGMVGTELAEDLVKAGHKATLLDTKDLPLATMLPSVAGERILAAIQSVGVEWLGRHNVQRIDPKSCGYELHLTDMDTGHMRTLYVDEIVVATGLAIDATLPADAGLSFNARTGIVVNPKTLQTSIPHIYALGDCISIDGVACRYVAVHKAQATAIAHAILGLDHIGYDHKPPMIRLKNKSISVTGSGLPRADGDWHISAGDHELSLEMTQDGAVLAKFLLKG